MVDGGVTGKQKELSGVVYVLKCEYDVSWRMCDTVVGRGVGAADGERVGWAGPRPDGSL